eukprot:m.79421 g.79421  ORF g.79421 m.79421 type:complete len:180 (-) comp16270_c0_seq4:203-742(-)
MSSSALLDPGVLNAASNEDFEALTALLFEHSPVLAEALRFKRPFTSAEHVIDEAEKILCEESEEETQITILSSHPLIGASATNMSAASQAEQQASSNGEEDAETRAVLARLNILNKAYSDKFGFPFIVFVNGRSKAEIVPVFEQRLQGTRADELRTACTDYIAIARSRLAKVVAAASSL